MKDYRTVIGTRGYSVCLFVDGVVERSVQFHTDLFYALQSTWALNMILQSELNNPINQNK